MMQMLCTVLLTFTVLMPLILEAKEEAGIPPVVMGTVWHRTSAEYRALCYQAYNLATMRLAIEAKQVKKDKLPAAVILDIDETILDNSPYTTMLIKKREHFSYKSWRKWVAKKSAPPIPGAASFLHEAKRLGFEIFYVSNRKIGEIEDTYKNLKSLGLPVKKENMLFKNKTSDKGARRGLIKKKFRIALLVGDNMGDFTSEFYKKDYKSRLSATDSSKNEYGKKFIIIPNTMYGDWESALYNYSHKLSPKDKAKLLIKTL